jgi:hypothetical protein
MGRTQVVYSENELLRPTKFIIVVCDRNIDTHIIDIEEARKYVEKFNRRAIIVSNKEIFKDEELPMLKYNFIMNATTPALKLIDHCGQSYKTVFKFINSNFKCGVVIAHEDTLTNEIADTLAQNKDNGLDFVLYRPDLMQLSGNERTKMNYIRFHANSEFSITKENLRLFTEKFGQNIAIGIFTCQMIVNYQYKLCQDYFTEHSERYKEAGLTNYIDYYAVNKQQAYHVYYDTMRSKIIGFDVEKIKFYMEYMFHTIGDKVYENKAGELAVMYS